MDIYGFTDDPVTIHNESISPALLLPLQSFWGLNIWSQLTFEGVVESGSFPGAFIFESFEVISVPLSWSTSKLSSSYIQIGNVLWRSKTKWTTYIRHSSMLWWLRVNQFLSWRVWIDRKWFFKTIVPWEHPVLRGMMHGAIYLHLPSVYFVRNIT